MPHFATKTALQANVGIACDVEITQRLLTNARQSTNGIARSQMPLGNFQFGFEVWVDRLIRRNNQYVQVRGIPRKSDERRSLLKLKCGRDRDFRTRSIWPGVPSCWRRKVSLSNGKCTRSACVDLPWLRPSFLVLRDQHIKKADQKWTAKC